MTTGYDMKKWIFIVLLTLAMWACKSKKRPITEDETITTADFIGLFENIKPPYTIGDSSFEKKMNDTSFISYKKFTSVIPDSILSKQFKNFRPRIYPLGKIALKKQETYLLLKAVSAAQKAAYILVFDKDKKFITSLPLLIEDNNEATEQSAVMDYKFSITTNTQHKTTDGRLLYKKEVYAYISSASAFALILTESNEIDPKKELINPIDTLPRKNKFAGDYRQDKMNLVSIRDSKKPGLLAFFVHFEKDEGRCKGELKGEAKIISPGKALFKQSGDPCELEFSFTANTVNLKEDGCGSHRDIKCFFEGTFTRRAPAKPVKQAKPAKKK
jgi:hypothetical protein